MDCHSLSGFAVLQPEEDTELQGNEIHFHNAVIANSVFPSYAKPTARGIRHAILDQFPNLAHPVVVSRFGSDFVIQFDNPEERDVVVDSSILHSCEFSMELLPWSDRYGAQIVEWKTKVTIDITGIPPHTFVRSALAPLLEPYCSIQTCGFHSAKGVCRVDAFALNTESIPKTTQLAVQFPIEEGVRNVVFPITLAAYPYGKAPYLGEDDSSVPLNRTTRNAYTDPEQDCDSAVYRDRLEEWLEDEHQVGIQPTNRASDSDYDSEGHYLPAYRHDSEHEIGSDYSGPYS